MAEKISPSVDYQDNSHECQKTGLLPDKTGELILADIGIPPGAYSWKTLQLEYTSPFGDRFRIPLQTIIYLN